MKFVDESILFFSRVSLSKFSGSTLHFMGIRGIYTGVCMECEESVFLKYSGLVTWSCDLTESQVQVAS